MCVQMHVIVHEWVSMCVCCKALLLVQNQVIIFLLCSLYFVLVSDPDIRKKQLKISLFCDGGIADSW